MKSHTRGGSKGATTHLSPQHRHALFEESGISPDVIAERGVRTVTHGRPLPDGFSRRQRRLGSGILFTGHAPDGSKFYIFRPNRPNPQNPGQKYEMPPKAYGGPGNRLDIHPSCRHLLGRKDVPVVFVEGIKKADALISAARAVGVEILAVAIMGTWNWMSEGKPIPDMLTIPVGGRRVTILFDSDVLHNPGVQGAARAFAEHLIERGADPWVTFLPDQEDGAKTGADDFLAGGGTLRELWLLSRRYDPEDFALVRLSRDERLRAMVEHIERIFWATDWSRVGLEPGKRPRWQSAARDVYLVLGEEAARSGGAVSRGIRVEISWCTIHIRAKISTRTLQRCIEILERAGLIERDNESRKADKRGAFILRAKVKQYGTEQGQEVEGERVLQSSSLCTLLSRAPHDVPRLRNSSPGYRPRKGTARGTARGTSKVRQSPPKKRRPPVIRLGKRRGGYLDALAVFGRGIRLPDLAEALGYSRPRDLVRRKKPGSKGREGLLVWLLDAGIIAMDGDTVRLSENWREQMDRVRAAGREREQDEIDAARVKAKRDAFHNRHKRKADVAPTEAEMEEKRQERRQRERERRGRPISLLAAVLHDYLWWESPGDACQPPGWLANTLWAQDRYPGKPTIDETRVALDELGGEWFRRECMERWRAIWRDSVA